MPVKQIYFGLWPYILWHIKLLNYFAINGFYFIYQLLTSVVGFNNLYRRSTEFQKIKKINWTNMYNKYSISVNIQIIIPFK